MKKYIKAKSLVDTFLKYHDDMNNYHCQEGNFDKAYEILDKYGDSNDYDIREAFLKADPDDQNEIVRLITPKAKYGEKVIQKCYTPMQKKILLAILCIIKELFVHLNRLLKKDTLICLNSNK